MDQRFDFKELVSLCRQTHEAMQQRAARSVNIELVVRNWLFGWYIVEYEQKGADKAQYGNGILKDLAKELKEAGLKGASTTNLKQCCTFYLQQALSVESLQNGQAVSDELVPQLASQHLCIEISAIPSVQGRAEATGAAGGGSL